MAAVEDLIEPYFETDKNGYKERIRSLEVGLPLKQPFTKDISDWLRYERFIADQIPLLREYERAQAKPGYNFPNVPELECSYERSSIKYWGSQFGKLEVIIARLFAMTGIQTTKEAISMLSIFSSDKAHYFEKYLIHWSYKKVFSLIKTCRTNIDKINKNNSTATQEAILGGTCDSYIMNSSLTYTNRNKPIFQIGKKKFREEFDTNYQKIIKLAETKPVCFIAFTHRKLKRQIHAIGCVLQKTGENEYKLFIYDPMYYIDTRGSGENPDYTWAVQQAYVDWKLVMKELGLEIKIQNLSDYCYVKEGVGVRCSQYYVNAEYCLLYSMYFIYLYSKHNFPTDAESLRSIVEETYISKPSELSRAPCSATNEFRVRMFSFIMSCYILFAEGVRDYKIMTETYNQFYLTVGIRLLHPDILEIGSSILEYYKIKGFLEYPIQSQYFTEQQINEIKEWQKKEAEERLKKKEEERLKKKAEEEEARKKRAEEREARKKKKAEEEEARKREEDAKQDKPPEPCVPCPPPTMSRTAEAVSGANESRSGRKRHAAATNVKCCTIMGGTRRRRHTRKPTAAQSVLRGTLRKHNVRRK